jgi:hypothetical protein
MGSSNSKNSESTINWNGVNTPDFSSSLPNFNGLSGDAKQLIASLNIPTFTESQTSEFTVNHILDKINTGLNNEDQNKFNELLENVSEQSAQLTGGELSDTSPFISSEMYNYLIHDNDNKQVGGSKKITKSKKSIKSKRGGSLETDDSSTSSTSDNDDSDSDFDKDDDEDEFMSSTHDNNKKKHDKKSHDNKKHDDNKHDNKKKHHDNKNNKHHDKHKRSESESEMSGGELSYISSSAHTDREFSDTLTKTAKSSRSSTPVSSVNSSVTDENNEMRNTSTVNTDDINMISDY